MEKPLAFKDMTPEQRAEIVEAWVKDGIEALEEWYGNNWHLVEWHGTEGMIHPDHFYRVMPKRQLDIPWHMIKPYYKWAAMNKGGDIFVYSAEPTIEDDDNAYEWSSIGFFASLEGINIDTYAVNWRESLVKCPEDK